MFSGWWYAILCVAGPVVWGLVVYLVSGAIERRILRARKNRTGDAGEAESLSVEYYI